jgi:uncharacterized protein YbbC (DUF1343 family)
MNKLLSFVLGTLFAWPGGAVAQVKPGIDVLRDENFKAVANKRVGLVVNPASVDSKLVPTVDVLRAAPNVKLVALFGPEHGVYGDEYAGERVADKTDARTGIPAYSLYGANRKPTAGQMRDIDALVFDLQDIGSRSYTYIFTMKNCMEACSELDRELVILDRPNPLGGTRVEGPMLSKGYESGVSAFNVPYVHGMTMGELAQFVRDNLYPNFKKLSIVKMSGWRREMVWADTGLAWVPTSPHIPQASSCAAYAATGILGELKNVSNGVGYTLPFEIIGAPWIDGEKLADQLNAQKLEGVYFRPVRYKPFYATFKDEPCQGVQVHIDAKRAATLVEINYRALAALGPNKLFGDASKRLPMFDKVSGSDEPRVTLTESPDLEPLFKKWKLQCAQFREERKKWLLYE